MEVNTSEEKVQLFGGNRIRSVWGDLREEWYFSVVDVIGVLTEQVDNRHAAKYWSVLKNRLKEEGSELTTNCSQLKMTSADGKKYKTDVMTTEQILRLVQSVPSKKAKSILILHRNNETQKSGSLTDVLKALKEEVVKRKIMEKDESDEKVKIMTMHKSKGLEAEMVIILEADEGVIPKTHPDTILYSMFGETEKVAMDDQKRLFYVAMTRAKKRLYIIHKPGNDGFIKFLGRGVEKMEEIL